MGYASAGLLIGPAFGPTIGGLLAQYLGWRATFWFLAIYTAVLAVLFTSLFPETCRNVVGNGSIKPQGWNMTLVDYIRSRRSAGTNSNTAANATGPKRRGKIPLPNPLRTLKVVAEKDMQLILFFNTLIYLIFIITVSTLSTLFARIYNFNVLQIGLCYIPYGLGCCLAGVITGPN